VLAVVVERAIERSRLFSENSKLRERLRERNAFGHVIGGHANMVKLLRLVEQVAPSRASVLIHGETGTGKELIAEMIHRASPRARAPLVRLNCAALSESLLESELFGHEKGAFTGAVARREGRFEQANGGTVFLDEVSEIPMSTQVKLLRFLQERTFERVGGNETLKVDVRILAATNRDLRQRIAEGLFREDLYYRLNVVTMEIPPLRDRVSDVPELSTFFLKRYAQENGKRIEGFSDEALAALSAYAWPGNVRELENAIERAVVLCDATRVELRHLPASIHDAAPEGAMPPVPGTTIYDLERYAILRTLESCKGSTSKAATILGISPRKIQYKLHEYASARGAPPPDGPPSSVSPRDGGDEP
jgi:DNA-binding NtrC family response regulator